MGIQRLLAVDLSDWAKKLVSTHVSPYTAELLGLSFLSLVAYGFAAFNHTLTSDDWYAFQNGMAGNFDLRIGRWLQLPIGDLLEDNRHAPAFTLYFMLLCCAIGSLIAAHDIRIRTRFGRFTFVALFLFSPFWAEPVTFKMMHVGLGVSVLLGFLFGHFAWRAFQHMTAGESWRKLAMATALSAVFFSLSASLYQPSVVFGALLFLFAVVRRMVDDPESLPTSRAVWLMAVSVGIPAIGGLVLYVVEARVAMALVRVWPKESGEYALVSSLVTTREELMMTLDRMAQYIVQFLFGGQHLFPWSAKVGFWMVGIGFLVVVFRSLGRVPQRARPWRALVLLALLALILWLPWALGSVRVPNTYRYNSIGSAALIFAGVFAIAIESLRTPLIRSGIGIVSGLVLAIFVFQHNHAALTTYTLNRRDFAVAARVLDRIETRDTYAEAAADGTIQMVLLGNPDTNTGRPFIAPSTPPPMLKSSIQAGVFDQLQFGYLVWAMRLIQLSAVDYEIVPLREFPERAQRAITEFAKGMQPWPHPTSIEFIDDQIVVLVFE